MNASETPRESEAETQAAPATGAVNADGTIAETFGNVGTWNVTGFADVPQRAPAESETNNASGE
jgi:hypothetical protein